MTSKTEQGQWSFTGGFGRHGSQWIDILSRKPFNTDRPESFAAFTCRNKAIALTIPSKHLQTKLISISAIVKAEFIKILKTSERNILKTTVFDQDIQTMKRNSKKRVANFMLIKIRYPNHRHGSDVLYFVLINYGWVWEIVLPMASVWTDQSNQEIREE